MIKTATWSPEFSELVAKKTAHMSKAAISDELESVKIGRLKGFGSIAFAIAERVAGLEVGHHGATSL